MTEKLDKLGRKPRTFPRLSRALHAELLRQAGTYGVPALAQRMGVDKSNLYRIIRDSRAPMWRSTIDAITAGLSNSNGHGSAYSEAAPSSPSHAAPALPPAPAPALQPDRDFTLRVTLPVKRAERLVAHCDLVGIPLSQFVGNLIDKHLDAEWGQES